MAAANKRCTIKSAYLMGLGWVGLGWVGLGWVGLGWVGLGWVGLGWVGVGVGVGVGGRLVDGWSRKK